MLLRNLYSQLAATHNFTCIQLLRPDKYEMEDGRFVINTTQLTQGLNTLPNYTTFNLLTYYLNTLQPNGANKADPYFGKTDGHHNATGYALMAQAVATAVKNEIANKARTLHR